MNKPLFLPAVPKFVLSLFLGDRSELVTTGNVVDISKLKSMGFQFDYPDFEDAMRSFV